MTMCFFFSTKSIILLSSAKQLSWSLFPAWWVSQTFIPEESGMLSILPELDCGSFSFILIAWHGNSCRGSPTLQTYFSLFPLCYSNTNLGEKMIFFWSWIQMLHNFCWYLIWNLFNSSSLLKARSHCWSPSSYFPYRLPAPDDKLLQETIPKLELKYSSIVNLLLTLFQTQLITCKLYLSYKGLWYILAFLEIA